MSNNALRHAHSAVNTCGRPLRSLAVTNWRRSNYVNSLVKSMNFGV